MSSFYSVPGQAATVQVGTVTTVAPENAATVTNSGTPTAAVLNFNIPRGITGNVSAAGDGTAALPSITFANDVNTGIYSPGPDELALSVNGSEGVRLTTTGLGIGTSSPGNMLHIAGSNPQVQLQDSDGTNQNTYFFNGAGSTYLRSQNNTSYGYIYLQQFNGTTTQTALTIDSSQRVGIGTTGPTALLHLYSATDSTTALRIQNDNTGSSSAQLVLVGQGNNFSISNYGDGSSDPNTTEFLSTAAGSQFKFSVNGSERARIDSSGRLLVGVSSDYSPPSQNLIAQFNAVNTTVGGIAINNWSTSGAAPGGRISLTRANATTPGTFTACTAYAQYGQIDFWGSDGTKFVEAARITAYPDGTPGTDDMPGRLIFSTTADGASSPTERMRINSAGLSGFYSTDGNTLYASSSKASGTVDNLFVGTYGATAVYTGTASIIVRTNGNVLNTNNSYAGISDAKLKENIVDANSQWSDIKALQVRNYNFKEGQTHTQLGLIAQEVELVSPGLVSESPDRDEDGNDLGTVTKSVNYSVLYMKAVKALQEAMERIETLEAKVAALESA